MQKSHLNHPSLHSGDSCVTPVTVLKAELPLSPGGELRHWPLQPAGWRTLDLQRSKATFESFNWFKPVLAIPKAIQGGKSIALGFDSFPSSFSSTNHCRREILILI